MVSPATEELKFNGPPEMIAIYVQDPLFYEAYVASISCTVGASRLLSPSSPEPLGLTHDEWEHLSLLILDCKLMTTVDPHTFVDYLERTSSTILLLNVTDAQSSQISANDNLAAKSRVGGLSLYPGYIPESALEESLRGLQQGEDAIAIAGINVWRNKRLVTSEHGPMMQGTISADAVTRILALIKDPIHDTHKKLKELFVRDSTAINLPETNTQILPKRCDVNTGLTTVRNFLKTTLRGDSRKSAHLVVGEKGTGKTTVVHYAAMDIADDNESTLLLSIDYQWAVIGMSQAVLQLTDAFSQVAIPEPKFIAPEQLAAHIEDLRRKKAWLEWPPLQLPTVALLTNLLRDPGFHTALFARLTSKEELVDHLIDEYGIRRIQFTADVDSFVAELLSDPRRALLLSLEFALASQRDDFATFTWQRLVAAINRASQIRPAVKAIIKSSTAFERLETLMSQGPRGSEAEVRHLGHAVLRALATRLHVVLFFDNLDHKYDSALEVRLLLQTGRFMNDVWTSVSIPFVVAVRNSTYSSEGFRRVDMVAQFVMTTTQLSPPALDAVLRKRVEYLRRVGVGYDNDGLWFVGFLNKWVQNLTTGRDKSGLIQLIESRYPYNVRGQLEAFSETAASVHMTEMRLRNEKAESSRQSGFANLSVWFYQRAFFWGKAPFYVESQQDRTPNIYDNGFPESPYNAILRSWVILWFAQSDRAHPTDLTSTFLRAGVPERETERAVGMCTRFNLIRELYEGQNEWVLTHWGREFRTRCMFELAYIQTVWWDTAMLAEFDLGSPTMLSWERLPHYAGRFERWIRLEEAMAFNALSDDCDPFFETYGRVWSNISTNIGFALLKIENKLRRRWRDRPKS